MEPYLSEIRLFAGKTEPEGWKFCNGQSLEPWGEYDTLFTLIGTTYGGDGASSFNLPDFRGRVPVHQGSGPGLQPIGLGEMNGEERHRLNIQEMPAHKHGIAVDVSKSTVSLKLSAKAPSMTTPVAGASLSKRGGTTTSLVNAFIPDGAENVTLNPATAADISVTNAPAGGNGSHENMYPFVALNYIICTRGVYPPHG